MKPKIGIRPIIDGRMGIRETLENKTMRMSLAVKSLIESNVHYLDGTVAECVICDSSIGGVAEAALCEKQFKKSHVVATISVTPCWAYGTETMDLNPQTIKAIWGFNGTERPGAVYLAAAMSAHTQRGLPAYAIYGRDVQDIDDDSIPDDVKERLLAFTNSALAVGQMQGKSYVSIGGVSMGIMGSFVDPLFFQKYLGMRVEWLDMSEVNRRISLNIFDHKAYQRAMSWIDNKFTIGFDKNEKPHTLERKRYDWEISVKLYLIIKDIMLGNPLLKNIGWSEEAMGKNAIAGGFQGQRAWSDYMPNCDFAESILNTTFDWDGKKPPLTFATENDSLNAVSMLFANLLTQRASVFADVRTYWSPESIKRVTGWETNGLSENGFIHMINSGSAALDGAGECKFDHQSVMKQWWDISDADIAATLSHVDWCPADLMYFRGGGYSSHFKTNTEMPMTMIRVNLVDGKGPVIQIIEGHSVVVPNHVMDIIEKRTDPTWPTTFFAPRLNKASFPSDVYTIMAKWGSNHCALAYGHIGQTLITFASMLRIPVSMHNVDMSKVFRPHAFSSFGTQNDEQADFAACHHYGPLYK